MNMCFSARRAQATSQPLVVPLQQAMVVFSSCVRTAGPHVVIMQQEASSRLHGIHIGYGLAGMSHIPKAWWHTGTAPWTYTPLVWRRTLSRAATWT